MKENFKRTPRSPWHNWYTEKAWLDASARHLASEPYCRACATVRVVRAADEVDHIRPHRGDRRLFFDGGNLQSLCKSCHSRKTAQEIAGRHMLVCPPPVGVRVSCVDAGPGSSMAEDVATRAHETGWRVLDIRKAKGRARVERWNDGVAFVPGVGRVLVLSAVGGWQERQAWVDTISTDGIDRVLVCPDVWCARRTEGRATVRVVGLAWLDGLPVTHQG